jgi:hypothetical protein
MSTKKEPAGDNAAFRLQHFSQNEARALTSIYKYYRSDEELSTSTISLAIINDLARNHHERSCMQQAVEEYQQPATSRPSTAASFLIIFDYGRELLLADAKGSDIDEDNEMSRKYHFLRLLNDYQRRCHAEGKYLLAKEFMEHALCLRKEEETRQIQIVKRRHKHDRNKLVTAHTKQMEEFKESKTTYHVATPVAPYIR